jgi:hypothetical protein
MTDDSGVMPEADEADEYEQMLEAVPGADDRLDADARPWEANEADLIEQTRSVPMSDDDEGPDER